MNTAFAVCLALVWYSWPTAADGSECGTNSPRVTPPWFSRYIPDLKYTYPSIKGNKSVEAVEANHDVIRRVYDIYFEEYIKDKLDCVACNLVHTGENRAKWEVIIEKLTRLVVKAVLEEGENVDAKVRCPHPSNCVNLSDKEYCGCPPLYLAVKWGEAEQVKLALERGADLNITCGSDIPLLMVSNRWAVIKLIIENGTNINIRNNNGENLLHKWANRNIISESMEEVLKFLLKEGIDINEKNSAGDTALLITAYKQHYNCFVHPEINPVDKNILARGLLKHGADVDARNEKNWTSLHIATHHCNIELVRMLLEAGSDVNSRTGSVDANIIRENWTSLHIATYHRNIELVRMFLEAGADVNSRTGDVDASNWNNWTALHIATYRRNIELVRMLLDAGGEVNSRSGNGETPLLIAVHQAVALEKRRRKRLEKFGSGLVRMLLEAGADVDAKADNGKTSLLIVVDHYVNLEPLCNNFTLLRLLIGAGADLNAKQENDLTALHLVVQSQHWEFFKLIILESSFRIIQLAELLIDSGANVNAKDVSGYTPLHYAVDSSKDITLFLGPNPDYSCGKMDVIDLLIKNGADVDAKQNKGWTPLHLAVFHHDIYCVQLLISNGANVNAKQNQGWTPWMMANRMDQIEMAELLAYCGAEKSVPSRVHNSVRRWWESAKDFLVPSFLKVCHESMGFYHRCYGDSENFQELFDN